MRRKAGSASLAWVSVLAVLAASLAAGYAAAGKIERPESRVVSTVKGQYEVRRSGEGTGVEDFVRTRYSNNVTVVETVYEVIEKDSVMVSGNNRLEYEDDSGFPRKYFSFRRSANPTEEHTIEVTIEMFANVAVIDERQDERSWRRVVELPTGCLFIEGNIASQLTNVLERFSPTSGGKQGFRAFDPLGGSTTEIALEAAGDSTIASPDWVRAEKQNGETVSLYRYHAGRYPGVDLFVDANGIVTRINSGFHDMEYVLVRFDVVDGEGGSSK